MNEVIRVLNEQRSKLRQIHTDYYSAYDAAFDEHSAMASLQRWADRTGKLIHERLSKVEATKFRRASMSAPRGRGSWHWGELCQYLDTYLLRLIEDIEEYSDDPSFNDVSQVGAQEAGAAKPDALLYDVFLSYSAQDKDEARSIHDLLGRVGKKCFLAEKSLHPGDKFQDEIRNAIVASKEIWILVSPNSIKSAWVLREASAAWALNKRIIPILLRCAPSDLPDVVADAHAIDYHKVSVYIQSFG